MLSATTDAVDANLRTAAQKARDAAKTELGPIGDWTVSWKQ